MAQTLHDYFKTKYTADVVGLYGGQSQHGSPVKPPLVDALGRAVPEEYREAYELLSKDGRRVMCVEVGCTVPGERVAGDAIVCRDGVGIWKADRFAAPYPHSPWDVAYAYNVTHADAARRALAMEAERLGKTEPANDDAIAEAAEARRAAAEKPADPMQGRTRCLRCGGDAGFLGLSCQRVGGCKTKAERVAALVPGPGDVYSSNFAHSGGERCWWAGDAEHGPFATRDLAVSAWRTAMAERMGE